MKRGVLALQGDFREHIAAVKSAGHAGLTVRRPEELAEIDALILPGGESTTIAQLAQTFNLFHPIRERISSGMPVYGSCAGMILLADLFILKFHPRLNHHRYDHLQRKGLLKPLTSLIISYLRLMLRGN